MAKTRRNSRKGSRKSLGLFGRVYSPVNHLFMAAENSVSALANGASGITRTGLGTVNKVGKSITGHADKAVKNIVSRKRRGGRKGRKGSRKSKKSRKNRKGSRKNRNRKN